MLLLHRIYLSLSLKFLFTLLYFLMCIYHFRTEKAFRTEYNTVFWYTIYTIVAYFSVVSFLFFRLLKYNVKKCVVMIINTYFAQISVIFLIFLWIHSKYCSNVSLEIFLICILLQYIQ